MLKSCGFFVLITLLGTGLPSQASLQISSPEAYKYSCATESATPALNYNYCVHHGDPRSTQDTIFFFHALNGSERSWFRDPDKVLLQGLWLAKEYKPTVVTFSLGPQWLLVQTPRVSLVNLFIQQILPQLEEKAGSSSGRKILIGQSMGGFNAVEVMLRAPQFFDQVVLWCPALSTVDPFASPEEIQNYIDRTGADPRRVSLMLSISRTVFQNSWEWKNNDPFRLLWNFNSPQRPELFTSTGQEDEFGFQEGTRLFAMMAESKGFQGVDKPVSGGHCRFDIVSAAHFIIGGSPWQR